MLEGRFADRTRYDRDSFVRAVCGTEPMGAIVPPALEIWRAGEASGVLVGGTITQLAASLGTPYAFDPPAGCVLFFDEVNERPYRLDRLLTQLVQAGIIGRASAIVFNELPGCDEPDGLVRGADAVRRVLDGFAGPIVAGFPSGHTPGATVTLPFGVRATVVGARPRRARHRRARRRGLIRIGRQHRPHTAQGDSQRCRIAFTSSGSAARRWPPSPRCSRRAAGTSVARTNRSIRR